MLKLTQATHIRVPIAEKRQKRYKRFGKTFTAEAKSGNFFLGYSGHQTSIIGRDV
jgi:hypothetical protein